MSCSVVDVVLNRNFAYEVLPDKTHALAPLDIVVKCERVAKPVIGLAAAAMPFGFLESVSVVPLTRDVAMPDFRLSITKTTGRRSSVRTSRTVCCLSAELGNDNDAADEAYKTLLDATGHNLKFRMTPADIMLSMDIEFYAIPPTDFYIVYHGANGVPVAALPDLHTTLQEKKVLVDYLFKPMHPKNRLKLVMDIAKDLSVAEETQQVKAPA